MASGRVPDYLGFGLAADRPAAPSLATGCIGLWWSTDTSVLSVWDGAWEDVSASSSTLAVSTVTSASGTLTLDFSGASKRVFKTTLTENVTVAFSNLPSSGNFAEYELHITQDGTGSRTFAIPASHKALGASDTVIASAAGAVTVLTASTVDGGTTWRYAMQESA